jgi:C4-dicarboxylate transporter DctM subunit
MVGFLTLFVGLLARKCPSFWSLGPPGAMFVISGQPLVGAAQLVINELNSPTLMALPLFVMAAAFMRFGGVVNALVNLASVARWTFGTLSGSSWSSPALLFAAICGSSDDLRLDPVEPHPQ